MSKKQSSVSTVMLDNKRGVCAYEGGLLTFEIEGGIPTSNNGDNGYMQRMVVDHSSERSTLAVAGVNVVPWGAGNQYPQDVAALISEHKLLPSIIARQVEYLFGNGIMIYKRDDEGKKMRVDEPAIAKWLDSFETFTGESAEEYLLGIINDYYHVNTCVSKWHFSRSRRINGQMPVAALSYVGADTARLATDFMAADRKIYNRDCCSVVVADWSYLGQTQATVFDRFDPANPLKSGSAISFNRRRAFGYDVYSRNTWFGGLKEWLKASNLTPKYLNSYLKNALNAHVHCKIPKSWYDSQQTTLQDLCNQNLFNAADPDNRIALTESYKGVGLLDSKGKPRAYDPKMMIDLVNHELKRITESLSGEGNQGKLYASLKIGQDAWEFEKMPGDFKEYFDSVIAYDKRADQVSLAGIGINSSITNVENEGQLSKSGSDVYYNYVIYLHSLTIAEDFVCKDINKALKINFVDLYNSGVRIGLDIRIPQKIQDIAPADRIDTMNE